MIIEITSPDVEALIHQRMQTGAFNSPEDVVRAALRLSGPDAKPAENASGTGQELLDIGARVRGLLTNEEVDSLFARNRSVSRSVDPG